MIVYTVMPLIAEQHHPRNSDFRPLDVPRHSLYDALHESSKSRQPMPAEELSRIPLDEGFAAIVRREIVDGHPMAAFIRALGRLRDFGLDREAEKAGLLGAEKHLTIPGQANSTSITGPEFRPTEGVVLIVCDERDWHQKDDVSLEVSDGVLPELHDLEDGTLARYEYSDRGSYVTSDGRGIVLDVSFNEIHDDLDSADPEIWPALLGLAAGHARRSYDISVAAQLCDLLGTRAELHRADHAERLDQLRRVQMRLTARGVQAVLEHKTYEPFIADDGFRIHHRLNQINSTADRDISEAFGNFQPLIEAAEAEAAAQRRRESENLAKQEAAAEESRRRRIDALTKRAGGAVAGAGLLGIFAAIAAIPRSGAALSPNLRAAFATLALAGAVAAVAMLLEKALEAKAPNGHQAQQAATLLGWLLLAGGLVGAWLAWLGNWASSPALLITVLAMMLVGGTLLLKVRSNDSVDRPSA